MNEEELMNFTDLLTDYLETKKVFVQNPQRMAEVNAATETACRLFPEAEITIEDDPIQMGAVILSIKDYHLIVRETTDFIALICAADNFEIYETSQEKIELNILFSNALTRI